MSNSEYHSAWRHFKNHKRGFWSYIIFVILLIISLLANIIANDKPLLVYYDGHIYVPLIETVSEADYGGFFETEADYTDIEVQALINERGWYIMPLIEYSYKTLAKNLPHAAPTPPDATHILGTDDEAGDVAARLIYGYRISVLFGLALTILSSIIGIMVGALQGYYGGAVDIVGQRFLEIWGGMPVLFLLIILSAIIQPNFWLLLGLMLLFSWTSLVGVVRAETLKVRNLGYVRTAQAMGLPNYYIIYKHILPNALTAAISLLPFIAAGSVGTLTALDFIGFGLPPGSPSLGALLKQGQENLEAYWLGITAFSIIAVQLSLMIFIGEGVRDAFDPRRR